MDEDNTLFMLCDPKKCKTRKQINMDTYLNSYNKHQNELLNTIDNNTNTDNNINMDNNNHNNFNNNSNNSNTKLNEKNTEIVPEFMIEVVNHINKIDEFILNNNYDKNMEKINDYLIDLLFLIKSKKKIIYTILFN